MSIFTVAFTHRHIHRYSQLIIKIYLKHNYASEVKLFKLTYPTHIHRTYEANATGAEGFVFDAFKALTHIHLHPNFSNRGLKPSIFKEEASSEALIIQIRPLRGLRY